PSDTRQRPWTGASSARSDGSRASGWPSTGPGSAASGSTSSPCTRTAPARAVSSTCGRSGDAAMTPLGRTWSVALVGLAGHLVEVEAHLAVGIPAFTLIGLPDTALAEARDRVRAAVTSCGLGWPQRRTTV